MEFRFIKFEVYQKAKLLHRKVVFLTKSFPPPFFYLRDQLRRSALSVVLAIAEGAGSGSDKNFKRYLKIALGSVNETVAGLDVAVEEKLISRFAFENLSVLAEELKKQLGAFCKRLGEK